MGKIYDEIPDNLTTWIQEQKMFWVASAPLSPDGHVNVSPKGFAGSFRIEHKNRVWYEDLSGSGAETISHTRENGRLTIKFCAFQGPPRVVRLWGTGIVHEYGTPEYEAYLPLEKRQPGSRAVIVQDVKQVGTSCGFSIPFYTFDRPRTKLHSLGAIFEKRDIDAETTTPPSVGIAESATTVPEDEDFGGNEPKSKEIASLPRSKAGIKAFWAHFNLKSLDGLPGLLSAHLSTRTFDKDVVERDWRNVDNNGVPPPKDQPKVVELRVSKAPAVQTSAVQSVAASSRDNGNSKELLFAGILWGIVLSIMWSEFRERASHVFRI